MKCGALLILVFCLSSSFPAGILGNSGNGEDSLLLNFNYKLAEFWNEYLALGADWRSLNEEYLQTKLELNTIWKKPASEKVTLKLLLQKEIQQQELEEMEMALVRFRYRKGIDFVKLLYEKILSLEHHFVTVQTLQHIQHVSNPNSYEDFQQINRVIEDRLQRKQGVELPELLRTNPYASLVSSLVGSFFGPGSRSERGADLDKISCILDFTVRMHSDLKLIYFETEYLKSNTLSLKAACAETFREYIAPLNYAITLDSCRKSDSWDEIDRAISRFFQQPEGVMSISGQRTPHLNYSDMADLEFAITRLYTFIQDYADFIREGTHYYNKFVIILHNYENEASCTEALPDKLFQLQQDIENARRTYSEAYFIKELQGSRLKELLFGKIPQGPD